MARMTVQSTYLIMSLVYFVMPTFTWLVLVGRRSQSIHLWFSGSLLFAAGIALLGVTDLVPPQKCQAAQEMPDRTTAWTSVPNPIRSVSLPRLRCRSFKTTP